MKNFINFNSKIQFVLTDIDDTLTSEGQLEAEAYSAIWKLHNAGLKIIPITGRPAGWCEMIARFWPVAGIIGENGGFYFKYASEKDNELKKMKRWFYDDKNTRALNQIKLKEIEKLILTQVPGCQTSSDQFCRLMDLAIDFCEDVTPLDKKNIEKIVTIFEEHGATAKVSSIHVNGWFGNYNKLSTAFEFFKNEYHLSAEDALKLSVFVGDSPNDEPMFHQFPYSFGVANVLDFKNQIKNLPQFIANKKGGHGFVEIAEHIINVQQK